MVTLWQQLLKSDFSCDNIILYIFGFRREFMKKFIIISTALILLAAGFFGYSLYRYMQVTNLIKPKAAEATESVGETTSQDATAASEGGADASAAGIFDANKEKAAAYVGNMTKEQMAGQVIMGICTDTSTAASEINKYCLAGFLFESSGFEGMTAEQITTAMHTVTSQSELKPILAAQEEGGSYTTVSDLSTMSDYDFNSPRVDFAAGGLQAVEKAEDDKSTMLRTLGFNLNLAPVIDMPDSSDQIMYSRSISNDVDTVSAYAEYAAKFDQAKGVSVALKHFPGYGTIPDSAVTGTGAVVDERSADSIRKTDYQPFIKGAQAGARFIMVSNVVVKNIDSAHTAALSPSVHNELRSNVGFTGLIITDVLDGADYSAYADGKKPAVQAVLAGNDIVLVRDYAAAYNDILAAVNDGTISESQLKEACTRILAYKYTAGLVASP